MIDLMRFDDHRFGDDLSILTNRINIDQSLSELVSGIKDDHKISGAKKFVLNLLNDIQVRNEEGKKGDQMSIIN